ncbi:MAG: hypothetical protein A3F83_05305 [Candidatus Glassbacteria bacterium RIFCSPLOWO2_12_FULL_58_11]|uniref:Peptidase S9 prolyl oligopeptidase catalytic domain-containing protein n=1 Tax=Candidatus Glassbacteria bacterium RIFCSPLOWO2_12_FULL_58_11 TaxID=1817867 RepID=A0A1F5YQ94_9BACT|nr:MAG: hypothetical protein A3F83_05305 [Candidatus Glassbacteria bacterium RIFCSPLOWO2_12_FULL_58_11]
MLDSLNSILSNHFGLFRRGQMARGLLTLFLFCAANLFQARETYAMQAEFKYLDLPTFRTGEAGPLLGRIVLRIHSNDLTPVAARASLKIEGGKDVLTGETRLAYPGLFTALSFPVQLAQPSAEDQVYAAMLTVTIGEDLALSRPVQIYVRGSGMFFRTYRSRIDDTVYPYALYLPAGMDAADRQWPLVVSLHGAYSNYANNLKRLFGIGNRPGEPDELAFFSLPVWPELPPAAGIVVCPWGRGTMSYHGPGARDVLDVLTIVRYSFPVDPERISVTGLSMGGNGTWEMSLRYPAIFSAAVPVCAPSDMSLVGGFTRDVLLKNEERFPYIEKIIAQNQLSIWAANARAFPVQMYHGNDDPVVPVSHSEQMVEALKRVGIEAPLTRFDNVGHNAWDPAYKNGETLRRLFTARREKPQKDIYFTTCRYENARYDWLEIERFEHYGDFATIEARWEPKTAAVSLTTGNVALLKLYPAELSGLKAGDKLTVSSGKSRLSLQVPQEGPLRIALTNGKLTKATDKTSDSRTIKKKGLEGPIYEALSDRVLLVYGTGPEGESTLRQLIRFSDWGELPDVHFQIRPDSLVTENDMLESHLVLFGDERSNKLIGRMNSLCPVRFEGERVVAGKNSYARDEVAFKCIFPNPLSPNRLVLLNYAEEWNYTSNWSFNGVFKLLPDYLIYRKGADKPFGSEVLAAGFFDERWQW